MKKWIAVCLIVLMTCVCCSALAENWYCPQCGRLNDSNFCPADGTAKPQAGSQFGGNYTQYAYAVGTLNRKLATRTGPGTRYDEPGTFLKAGDQVTVLSKAYDSRNEIWWVQVEFRENGQLYRAYTGAKRFDGLNLQWIPEEQVIGSCSVSSAVTGYYGPSYQYKQIARKVPAGASCSICGYAWGENSDFIQIEFFDSGANLYRRAWVPDWAVDNYTMYYGF